MKLKNLFIITMIVSSLLFITTYSIEAVDVTITDVTGDVCSLDYLTEETKVITNHSDIEVKNLDLIQATYTQQGIQATLSLQVVGNIENRGNMSRDFIDGLVVYEFDLSTSGQYYRIEYCNRTGQLMYDDEQINLTSYDFSVVGDTLSITFSLVNANERYEDLSVASIFLNVNFSEEEPVVVFLADIAPNPPLVVYAYYSGIGYVGENIQFYGYIDFLSGHPPYTYYWDFGDGGSSTEQRPTHAYTEAGVYTFTFTVTDNASDTASYSNTIAIKEIKKAFLFARFTNMDTDGDFFIIQTVNLRMILFKPFQFSHYVNGQNIMFLKEYKGIIISNKLLIGMFNVIIDSEPIPNIACATDAPVTNTAILILQRLLPENIFNSLGCH
jgi:PKD repeat protein